MSKEKNEKQLLASDLRQVSERTTFIEFDEKNMERLRFQAYEI
jgi:hypothetical protein